MDEIVSETRDNDKFAKKLNHNEIIMSLLASRYPHAKKESFLVLTDGHIMDLKKTVSKLAIMKNDLQDS